MIHLRICCQIFKYWGIPQISFSCVFLNRLIREDTLHFLSLFIYAEIVLWHNRWSIWKTFYVPENNAFCCC